MVNMHTDRNDVTELIYAIANMSHAEYHMIESLMINQDIIDNDIQQKVLEIRNIRSSLMSKLNELRPQVNGIWCTLKHLLLTEFHLFELYERNLDKDYMTQAYNVHMTIDELLSIEGLENLKDCSRCDEDGKTKSS